MAGPRDAGFSQQQLTALHALTVQCTGLRAAVGQSIQGCSPPCQSVAFYSMHSSSVTMPMRCDQRGATLGACYVARRCPGCSMWRQLRICLKHATPLHRSCATASPDAASARLRTF
jgi:phage FluMu protein Com